MVFADDDTVGRIGGPSGDLVADGPGGGRRLATQVRVLESQPEEGGFLGTLRRSWDHA